MSAGSPRLIAYAMPAFFLAVVGIPVYVYIPKFYTDVVGIDIAVLGYLLFSVRIFDAVTDPAIGQISDRTRSRFGRRRPYIAAGSVLVAAAMYALFHPPQGTTAMSTIWFGIFIVVVVEMAQITPPIGFNLFVLQGMTTHEMNFIARAAIPMFLIMVVMVLSIH